MQRRKLEHSQKKQLAERQTDTVDGRNPAPPGMYNYPLNSRISYRFPQLVACRISGCHQQKSTTLRKPPPKRHFEVTKKMQNFTQKVDALEVPASGCRLEEVRWSQGPVPSWLVSLLGGGVRRRQPRPGRPGNSGRCLW